MKLNISSSLVAAVLLVGSPNLQGQTVTGRPWAGNAFSADAAAMIQAAQEELQADESSGTADGVVLAQERRYVLDEDGRRRYTIRTVFLVATPAGVEAASTVGITWKPWYQARPTIRARVISPDGAEHILDPATITESPADEGYDDIYGDTIVVNAPLPGISPGAVVEQEISVTETTTVFDRGMVTRVYLGGGWPVRHTRIEIEAPATVVFRYRTRLLPELETHELDRAGRVAVAFENGPLAPLQEFDRLMANDDPQRPYIAFSTGTSWAGVAGGYAGIVDAQIDTNAVAKIAAEAILGSETREEIAEKLLRRLHQDVRYTGVWLGNASIVPRPPQETLERGYGDCKDQAALLVALFRAAGTEAYVALLMTESGSEIEPDLPGFGAFNHAIVYVPGTPPLWIDPTDEFVRVGQLPLSDQGRLALVAAPETSGLIKTPQSQPADNRIVERREVFLSEEGLGRIVETSQYWGSSESMMRSMYSQMNQVEVREALESYAESVYLSETIADVEHTDPRDWSQPFQIRFEAREVELAGTEGGEAAVGIVLQPMLDSIPTIPEAERKNDLVLPEPIVIEWRYRIVPPPGFEHRTVPEQQTVQCGPAVFTREFSVSEDAVAATLRFDTKRVRFTPEESEALRIGLDQLLNSDPLIVSFDHIGESHLSAGRIREALAEFRRLAALHPEEALHHTQISRALLEGGMGEAAREEARRAIALQPTATAYSNLGWILQHDLVGRRFKKGFEPEEAQAAYRKAIEIEPSSVIARGDLAILLEHDAQGIRYGAEADLDGAIEQYEMIKVDLDPSNPLSNNLPTALMWARRFDELKEVLGSSEQSPALYLVAMAATDGPEEAVKEASRRVPYTAERHPLLLEAGQLLAQLRLYPEAASVLNAAAQGAPNPAHVLAQANLLGKVQRHEDLSFPETDPTTVVKRLFIYTFLSVDRFPTLFTNAMRKALSEDPTALSAVYTLNRFMRSQFEKQGTSPEVVVDIVLAASRYHVEGDESSGYRIEYRALSPSGERKKVAYVVVEDGQHRILATDDELEEIGRVALQFLDEGDEATARTWLDWAREEIPAPGGDDPLSGVAFTRFWTKGMEADELQIRLAAASLMAQSTVAAERAVPILQEGRKNASEDARPDFDFALALAFQTLERNEDHLEMAERLLKRYPDSNVAFFHHYSALKSLRRTSELRGAAKARLDRIPDDGVALRVLVDLAAREGDFESAAELDTRIAELGNVIAADLNNKAWRALFRDPFREEAIEDAQRAVALTNGASAPSLHTLASLYAEAGKPSDALEVIIQAMEVAAREEPDSNDWYVFGRISEQFGELGPAVAAFRKVEAPEPVQDSKEDPYYLAQKRLAILEDSRLE